MTLRRSAVVVVLLCLGLAACGGKKRPPNVAPGGVCSGSPSGRSAPSEAPLPVDSGPDLAPLDADAARSEDFSVTDPNTLEGGPLEDILFEYDQSTLTDRARAILEKHALWLQNHRAARVNRVHQAQIQAALKPELPPAWTFEDVEKAVAGPADGHLYLWAAQFYARAAYRPPHARVAWHPQPAAMKERSLALLRMAVEAGVPDGIWRADSNFRHLFGDPDDFAKDWARPGNEADGRGYWRLGDPLVEFAG